ncbi:hypothetical protein BC828DRAFT_381157 [Blastocladiella britannica]|nr:hypothetical protein BC828DRAFT_381157 [Blastocladiella britannica]
MLAKRSQYIKYVTSESSHKAGFSRHASVGLKQIAQQRISFLSMQASAQNRACLAGWWSWNLTHTGSCSSQWRPWFLLRTSFASEMPVRSKLKKHRWPPLQPSGARKTSPQQPSRLDASWSSLRATCSTTMPSRIRFLCLKMQRFGRWCSRRVVILFPT